MDLQRNHVSTKKSVGRRWAIAIVLMFVLSISALLLLWILAFSPLDFSQDYKEITGVENIVFQPNGRRDLFYKRSFWGLERADAPAIAIRPEDDEAVWEVGAFADMVESTSIRQAILSPDGNYVLYCELEYNYKNSGLTDDEYCYYKVYDIATGEVVTIYSGYKEWYNLGWL